MKSWEILDAQDHISEEAIRNSAAKSVAPGSVLVVVRSGVLKHSLPIAINRVRVAVNQDLKVLTCGPRLIPEYLARFLQFAAPRLLTSVRGTTVDNIPVDELRSLKVPLPPLPMQRRIAAILDKADAIRRTRKEVVVVCEELLRSAFLGMVGPAAADYGAWPVRTVGSLAANLPNSMRTGPFGSDLLHAEFVDKGIAVLGIDNAVKNFFGWDERRYITPAKYEKLRRYTVRPGDVIVTIMGTTGRSAVVPDDIPTAITTKHLATITLDRQQAEPEFVSQALFRHPEVLRQIMAANRGAIMSGLNLGLIKSLQLPIPPLARQREFASVTRRIRVLARRVEDRRLEEDLFNSLMARCFSGKVGAEALC
jgi:type I restriction enzyme S subunit